MDEPVPQPDHVGRPGTESAARLRDLRGLTRENPSFRLDRAGTTDPTRTEETVLAYAREGKRHLRRALKFDPEGLDPVEALVRSVELSDEVLKASTTRTYKQELLACLDSLGGTVCAETIASAKARVEAALIRRRGRPEPRTSARKVKDASEDEASGVLRFVHQRWKTHCHPNLDRVLLLYLLVAPKVGLRPGEYLECEIVGGYLVVRCAKATNGRAPAQSRRIGIERLSPKERQALAILAEHFPDVVREAGSYKPLLKRLAERLARACEAAGIRRLSLYSFRHVALATWKAAGLSRAEIAALAGHVSETTQSRSYAPARHGWDLGGGLAAPDPALVKIIAGRTGSAGPESRAEAGPNWMPNRLRRRLVC